jgi:hypothetical protein
MHIFCASSIVYHYSNQYVCQWMQRRHKGVYRHPHPSCVDSPVFIFSVR